MTVTSGTRNRKYLNNIRIIEYYNQHKSVTIINNTNYKEQSEVIRPNRIGDSRSINRMVVNCVNYHANPSFTSRRK